MKPRTMAQLEEAIGGFSKPGKMPCPSWSIPATQCNVGRILHKVEGSVCNGCYALNGSYRWPNTVKALARRLRKLADLRRWTVDMIEAIERKYRNKAGDDRVFRWFDSGDVQSLEHLEAINDVALALPDIDFWLPSKEYAVVRQFMRQGRKAKNLIIRMSAPMIGKAPAPIAGTVGSAVGTDHSPVDGFACPAYSRDGKCGPCRACWDPTVETVVYPLH